VAKPGTHSRWSAWWPFALLCLLAATRWVLNATLPTSGTTLLSASTGCAAAALVLLLASRISRLVSHRAGAPCPVSGTWVRSIHAEPRTILAGALLLAGPFFSLLLTGHGINPNSLTLALALAPIVAAVAQMALSNSPPGSFAARTWPALAAITGLLLLIPQPNFSNPVTDATLLLAPLATGIGAALFSTPSSPQKLSALPSTLSATALLFAAAWLIQFLLHHTAAHLSPLATLLDAVTAFLALFALSRIGLPRWSAQFALVPLMVILQGFVLLRPPIDAYNSTGLALLFLGCIFLLLPQPTEKAP
jgi:drug/metabolite transporter (DMT)-like permease